jgi:hypothetical protein
MGISAINRALLFNVRDYAVLETRIALLLARRDSGDREEALKSLYQVMAFVQGLQTDKMLVNLFQTLLERYSYPDHRLSPYRDQDTSAAFAIVFREISDLTLAKNFDNAFSNYRNNLLVKDRMVLEQDPVVGVLRTMIINSQLEGSISRKAFMLYEKIQTAPVSLKERLIYLANRLAGWVKAHKKEKEAIKQEFQSMLAVRQGERLDEEDVLVVERLKQMADGSRDNDLIRRVIPLFRQAGPVVVIQENVPGGLLLARLDRSNRIALIDIRENVPALLLEEAKDQIKNIMRQWGVENVDVGRILSDELRRPANDGNHSQASRCRLSGQNGRKRFHRSRKTVS